MTKSHFHLLAIALFLATIISSCTGQEGSVASNHVSLINQLEFQIETTSIDVLPVQQVGENILEIFEDSKGDIWFGTTDKGVARYSGKKLEYFSTEDGLCGKTVADIAEDKNGKLWFGTHSDMCIYDQQASHNKEKVSFIPFEKDGDIPLLGWGWKSVHSDKKGDIWVNTHHGIFQYKASEFSRLEAPLVSDENQSFCNTPGRIALYLIDDLGNMWFGSDGDGAYKYDGTNFIHFSQNDGLPSNNVTNIIEDKKGHIWLTCTHSRDSKSEVGGLCQFDGKIISTFKGLEGLYDNDLHTIYADKSGGVWIGATGVGIYHFDGTKTAFYKEPTGVESTPGVYTSGLQSVLEDSHGRMWMGFAGGLFRLDGQSFTNITVNGPWE